MSRPEAIPTVMVDNEAVKVTEWVFAPGAATGWHRHEMAYVIVPVTTQPVDIVNEAGETTRVQMTAGQSYYREAGIAHDVINAGDGELRFVETELKPARA